MNPVVKLGHIALRNDQLYNCYQFCVGGTKYREQLVQGAFAKFSPQTVLDLGCGPGPTLKNLPTHSKFYGVDLSSRYLKSAQRKNSKATLIQGDVSAKDWHDRIEEKTVDVVLAMGLFHHLDDNQLDKLARNLKNLMNSESRLISVDPTITPNTGIVAKWFADNDRGKFVRSPEQLVEFFLRSEMKVNYRVCKSKFNIPLDTIEIELAFK